ncbi:putative Mitogen-activated protein kinase kinase [Verrucomicrobia bacterium]|nr:putative Mitogen-activated protein kinase kinase [Verrucomicrobiota bacterium]
MTQPPEREIEVFNAALELPASERAAYLDQVCAGDAALRQRVEELLKSGEEAGAFLESPAVVPPGPGGTVRPAILSTEKPCDRIGRYKLLQPIGEGGCGVVYMAEQQEPVRRMVALKVIKLGMDTKNVIARFEAERQALAMMDHPNIAKVLDAGATETGRPYFVMELVRGIKITDYCDQNNLATKTRLHLFIQVCQAIQHAHQKGIIHRDIKPSNILVTLRDGVPVPKVIDFGIAKATTDQPLTDKTVFTAFEQFMGTPAYMSPEQAERGELGIDTRSDIYSLGILLYELLTGKTPFDAKDLVAAGLDAMRRTIREQEPMRPSTRLSTMVAGELTSAASHRQSEPLKMIHLVRGDLDWIAIKCLEKDRTRRYETAIGLARDIERHLNEEPVVASPPGNWYRFQKLVRRNKLAFAAAGAVAAALLLGLGVSTWSFFKEQQARQQAQADRKKAETEAAKSRQVAQLLQAMLQRVGPEVALGRDSRMLQEIMEETRQSLHQQLKDQPEAEAELRATLAETYRQLGDLANAETEYRQALRLQESVSGTEATNVTPIVNALAEVMTDRGELSGAEPIIREQLARSQRLFGKVHPDVATSLHELAVVLWQKGDLAGADELQRQALLLWRGFQDPKNISVSLSDLGLVLLDRGDLAGAEASFRESLDIRKKLLPPGHPGLMIAFNNLALALWYKGELAAAEAMDRQALETYRKLYRDGSLDTAASLNNLALVLRDRGDFAAAEPLQREALAMVEKAFGKDDPHAGFARNNLATLLRRRGAVAADPQLLREALMLNPTDPMTADAFACLLSTPFLAPVAAGAGTASHGWQWTSTQPGSDWAAPDSAQPAWPSAPIVSGAAIFVPRTSKNPIQWRTNLWLRREFELSTIPPGKLVFRINRNHDAHVFLNGVGAVPWADWSDTEVLLPAAGAGKPTLRVGRNVLAVHCQDADGGAPIDVQLFVTQEPNAGMQSLIEELDKLLGNEPGRAQLYVGRAAIFARLGRWPEAATNLSKALELKPSESTAGYQLAPLLLEINDLPGYGRLRHQALARFAQTGDPIVAGRIASLSLLVAAEGEDLASAVKLADEAAAAEYADGSLGWRQLAKGLAEYRRGRFADSVAWMDKALVTAGQQSLPGWNHEVERNRKAMAYFVKGMAHFRMRDPAAAQGALSQGIEIVITQSPAPDSGDLGRDWPDWLIAQLLLQEAQALIH